MSSLFNPGTSWWDWSSSVCVQRVVLFGQRVSSKIDDISPMHIVSFYISRFIVEIIVLLSTRCSFFHNGVNVSDLRWHGKALCTPCWTTVCNHNSLKVTSQNRIFSAWFFIPVHLLPAGSGYWRKSAPGDGERPDGPGQGWSAGLCLAGKP